MGRLLKSMVLIGGLLASTALLAETALATCEGDKIKKGPPIDKTLEAGQSFKFCLNRSDVKKFNVNTYLSRKDQGNCGISTLVMKTSDLGAVMPLGTGMDVNINSNAMKKSKDREIQGKIYNRSKQTCDYQIITK